MSPSTRIPLALLAASLVVACAERGGVGPTSGELRIEAPATELAEGAQLTLQVTAGGSRLDPARLTWESRNADALSVRDGVVRGIAPGMGWIVARSGEVADSIPLAVHFSQRPDGGAAVRLAGASSASAQTIRLAGIGLVFQSLQSDFRSTAIFAHSPSLGNPISVLDAAFSGDSTLSIRVPRQLIPGRHDLKSFTVETRNNGLRIVGGEGIYLRVRESDTRWRMYFAVGTSTLEVTSVSVPAAPGNIPGKLAGRVQFDAAGFLHTIGPNGVSQFTPIGDRVVPIYAEFAIDVYHTPVSTIVADVSGRYAGIARMGGEGTMRQSALSLYWNGLLNFGLPDETLVESTLDIPAPATGTFDLAVTAAGAPTLRMTFAKFVRVPPGDDPIGQTEDPITGTATAGTLTITEYRAPGDDTFGVLRGTLTTTIGFPSGAPATVAIQSLVLPIKPRKGDVLDPAPTAPGTSALRVRVAIPW